MNKSLLRCVGMLLAVGLAACAPIRTETVSVGRARHGCLNNVVDFGWDSGAIQFHALRGMGVDLVIHRATRGSSKTDDDYARREHAARHAGMKWGAYHYVQGGAYLAPQLHRFISTVATTAHRNGTAQHPVLLVLDNEGADRVSWEALAGAARLVRAHTGVWPLLYCSVPQPGTTAYARQSSELAGLTATDSQTLHDCGLWVPRYGEAPGASMSFSVPRVFGTWTLWQYCGDISGRPKYALAAPEFTGQIGAAFTRSGGRSSLRHFCDRNLFNGSRSEFERFYREHSSPVAAWR